MINPGLSRHLIIPAILQLLQSMYLWAVLSFITIYWIDKGFTHMMVGVLMAIFPLTSLIFMIPFGIIVDRTSPKRLVIISQLIFSLSIAGLIIAGDFWMTLIFLIIGGTGYSLFNNSLPALYYKILGSDFRGLKLGIFNASILIGYGMGPFIGGYLLTAHDMNAIFIFALSGLPVMLLLSAFLPDVAGTGVKISDYRADLTSRSVVIFLFLVFAFSLHAGAEQSSFSLFLNKDIGLNKESVGMIYLIHASVMAVFSIINGYIGDRFNARGRALSTLLYIGTAISGLTNIMLFFTFNFGTVLATRLSHAVGDSLTMVTRSLIVTNLFVSARMGGNLGAITTTVTLGTLVGSLISGAVPGYVSGFLISGTVAILAVILAVIARPDF